MSDPSGEKPNDETSGPESVVNDSQKAIRQNLSNFLNPGLPVTPVPPPDPNGALQLRMAQMELANKMRLAQGPNKAAPNAVPMHRSPPPGGFGSAHGVFHMRRGEFGKPTPPTPGGKPNPYQQIFANASKPEQEPEVEGEGEEDILEVPEGSEYKHNEEPKQTRGKRFRNPSL